ncbi:MAG: SAM-dependent methyltransferase [Lachnospiraceae bacterium]|nr:SAM-dependent methyltransferase [Lachnospiraceae bacterium]
MAVTLTFDQLVEKTINNDLVRVVLSKPSQSDCEKIKIRPVKIKDKISFQITRCVGSKESNTVKEIHSNMDPSQLKKMLTEEFPKNFRQALVETAKQGYTALAGKKGNVTVVKNKTVAKPEANLSHDKTKKYIIEEGTAVPFLVDLGVMTREGRVVKAKYDKFRQINRYLEFVNDVVDSLPDESDRELTIIDFGCGKSYLTFALYYYFTVLKKRNVHIIGLDLKTDVIKECNLLKLRYKYDKLDFIEGDIERFEGLDKVDMVISLHACDTATDYAIYKAIKWDADVIMAVPCCQHELNKSINAPVLKGITQYGLLKERLSSLFTDAIRANIITQAGYDTQILEFIDMEHTPKNILIRAVKGSGKMISSSKESAMNSLEELTNTKLTLRRLISESPIGDNNGD